MQRNWRHGISRDMDVTYVSGIFVMSWSLHCCIVKFGELGQNVFIFLVLP